MKKNEDGTYTLTEAELDKYTKLIVISLKRDYTQELLQSKPNEEVSCICCGRTNKIYHRQISVAQLKFMLIMYVNYTEHKIIWNFYKDIQDNLYKRFSLNCTDYSKLVDWGLIQSKKELKDDSNSTGYFCITKKGVQFLRGEITVPKYLIQDSTGKTHGKSEEEISVYAIDKDFNLNNLLNRKVA